MFERPTGGDAVVLVSIDFGDADYAESLQELRSLATTAGMDIRATVESKRHSPHAKYYIGSGKAEELKDMLSASESEVVAFNHDLSPSQQRNLERLLERRVVDRTGLILDIFAQRAQTHEGKLQVELAQMDGGAGESQLELDKRMLRTRVKQLKQKLDKLKHQRGMQRRARKRSNLMTVSLVGYTNAGKSTLFNRLTRSEVMAEDKLFATLDTTSRKMHLQDALPVILSDTVGFIKHLPTTLIEAFGATLEESVQADLLLHVVDVASPNREAQITQVNHVLSEIGANEVPQILVLNQIDKLDMSAGLERDEYGNIAKVRVSAVSGEGIDDLKLALKEYQTTLKRMKTEESAYS